MAAAFLPRRDLKPAHAAPLAHEHYADDREERAGKGDAEDQRVVDAISSSAGIVDRARGTNAIEPMRHARRSVMNAQRQRLERLDEDWSGIVDAVDLAIDPAVSVDDGGLRRDDRTPSGMRRVCETNIGRQPGNGFLVAAEKEPLRIAETELWA